MHKLFSLWCSLCKLLRKKEKYIPRTTWLSLKLFLFSPSSFTKKDRAANFPKPSKALVYAEEYCSLLTFIAYTILVFCSQILLETIFQSHQETVARLSIFKLSYLTELWALSLIFQGKILLTENCTWKIEID